MVIQKGSRIAVIGAGIAAANMLRKNGFVPVVFEEYERAKAKRTAPLKTLPLHT